MIVLLSVMKIHQRVIVVQVQSTISNVFMILFIILCINIIALFRDVLLIFFEVYLLIIGGLSIYSIILIIIVHVILVFYFSNELLTLFVTTTHDCINGMGKSMRSTIRFFI
jgi:hypothetical protein